MPITHLLKDFTPPPAPESQFTLMSEVALEDQRLAAFEQGYTAGWEDAFRAQEQDQTRIIGKLGQTLEDLSFSYQEARTELIRSVVPVLEAMVQQVLPTLMHETIGARVVEEALKVIGEQAGQPLALVVPTGTAAALQPILSEKLALPLQISESDALNDGQVQLRFARAEREIDMTRVLQALHRAVESFAYETEMEKEIG